MLIRPVLCSQIRVRQPLGGTIISKNLVLRPVPRGTKEIEHLTALESVS